MFLPLSTLPVVDPPRTAVTQGELSGAVEPNGVHVYRGVPFAKPPVGDLRWRTPEPPERWSGVRDATRFGPRAMQLPVFDDMVFRSNGMSEDCLYLNVWTPAGAEMRRGKGLPVLVYFYGGGFVGGDGSEPRYDGAAMAKKGMVMVTVNYRLGAFGFLAHPALSAEGRQGSSGNYGLMDQSEALRWVSRNIEAFGGDSRRITIGGESAGSFSVSAQMASPLSRDLLHGAIGESGAMFGGLLTPVPHKTAEANGVAFAESLKIDHKGSAGLKALRALKADEVLQATKASPFRFGPCVDGYFLEERVSETFAAGKQARIPLLVGWNAEEQGAGGVLAREKATPENFEAALKRLYPADWQALSEALAVKSDSDATEAARLLASARWITYGAWKWSEVHRQSGAPVYRYLFDKARPGEGGAYHAVEIEYALGNLPLNPKYQWTAADTATSKTMQEAFANFVKKGDPNGRGIPKWPAGGKSESPAVMQFDPTPSVAPSRVEPVYRLLDEIMKR